MKLDPCKKIDSKWIKDFNVKAKCSKLLMEHMGKTLQDTKVITEFLRRTWIAQEPMPRICKEAIPGTDQ